MKKLKHLWILILLFGLVSMSACGKPEEESVNPETVVDCAETIAAHQYLLKQHEELEFLYERAKSREAKYITAVDNLTATNQALQIKQAILEGLEGERKYQDLLNELLKLRKEKLDWGRFAEQEYEQLLENYNRLDALFPPTHFKDDKELIKWRANTGNVTEIGCVGLQKLALVNGYIVSAHPDLEYCVAIAGDYWYRITPGDQDLVEKVRKVK